MRPIAGEQCDLLTEDGQKANPAEDGCIETLFNALLDHVGAWRQAVLTERQNMQLAATEQTSTSGRSRPRKSRQRSFDQPSPGSRRRTPVGEVQTSEARHGSPAPVKLQPSPSEPMEAQEAGGRADPPQEDALSKLQRGTVVAVVKSEPSAAPLTPPSAQTVGESSQSVSVGEDCCGRGDAVAGQTTTTASTSSILTSNPGQPLPSVTVSSASVSPTTILTTNSTHLSSSHQTTSAITSAMLSSDPVKERGQALSVDSSPAAPSTNTTPSPTSAPSEENAAAKENRRPEDQSFKQ